MLFSVSILVLLEDGRKLNTGEFKYYSWIRFNPCSVGRRSKTAGTPEYGQCSDKVSILVLLEDGRKPNWADLERKMIRVSILVLLEDGRKQPDFLLSVVIIPNIPGKSTLISDYFKGNFKWIGFVLSMDYIAFFTVTDCQSVTYVKERSYTQIFL